MQKYGNPKPTIFSLEELQELKGPVTDGLIYIRDDEWEQIAKGLETRPKSAAYGKGLLIFPGPAGVGKLALPMCGPMEKPIFANGGWHCVPDDFDGDSPDPKDPITGGEPSCGSSYVVRGAGFQCRGACPRGYSCKITRNEVETSSPWTVDFVKCECEPLPLQDRLREPIKDPSKPDRAPKGDLDNPPGPGPIS